MASTAVARHIPAKEELSPLIDEELLIEGKVARASAALRDLRHPFREELLWPTDGTDSTDD